MSDRYTRKDVEEALDLFCKVAGLPRGRTYDDGGYFVDKTNLGYMICRFDGVGKSETFGPNRRNAKEMVRTLEFACTAIDVVIGRMVADR